MSQLSEDLQDVKNQFQSGNKSILANWKDFGDSEALIIVELLQSNPETEKLYLNFNKITDEGFLAVLDVLKDHKSPEELHFGSNEITDVGGKAFAEFLKTNHPSLKLVGLSQNNLTDDTCFAIADALKSNETMENLSLWGNYQMTDKGKAALEPFGEFFTNHKIGSIVRKL